MKPIVSQLSVEPPSSLEEHPNLPSVEEVNDLLVVCLGQMAVTAGSDLLWKPLNHEVLYDLHFLIILFLVHLVVRPISELFDKCLLECKSSTSSK